MTIVTAANRKTFLGIASFQVMVMFRRALFYSYLSIFLRFFLGLSVTETTFFATFPMILNILFQNYVWGPLSDRSQKRRTLIIIGEILAALSTSLVWYIHTFPDSNRAAGYVLIIGLGLVEIFWSMSNTGWTALISDLYPLKQRAGLTGRLQSVGAVGRLCGVWIGGMLYDGWAQKYEGWGFDTGVLFFIASGVMVLSTIPMYFIPEGGIAKDKVPKPVTNNIGNTSEKKEKYSTSRKFKVFIAAMVFIFFGLNSIILIMAQYLSLDEGFNVSSATLSYILSGGAAAVFIFGLLVKPVSRILKDEIILLCGAGLALVYLIGYIAAVNLATIFVSFFLGSTAFVLIVSGSYAYASSLIPPERRGKQFAMYNATMFLSWGIPGTFITGPLVDFLIKSGYSQVFSYRMSFVAAAILVVIGIAILLYNIRMNSAGESAPGQL